MQAIDIWLQRDPRIGSDATVELLGDRGTGVIDAAHPLPPGPVRLWPDSTGPTRHLGGGHLLPPHLDAVLVDGHLDGLHLRAAHLRPRLAIQLTTPAYIFGRFQHALRLRDAAGNVASVDALPAITINAAPTAPDDLRRETWDPVSRRLQFTFRPVRFTP